MKKTVFILLCLLSYSLYSKNNTQRIISLNGAVTEIICELGFQKDIIATDVTSTYPENLNVKNLGHVRNLSVESVLALKPTLVLGTEKDINPNLIAQLKSAGIKTVFYTQEFSVEGTRKLIEDVAKTLHAKNYASLQKKIDQDISKAKKIAAPKVLFIYARGAGTLMVAGKNTPMEKIIALSGGINAVNGFENFKPLTPEALLNANPDYILLFSSGLESLGGIEGALKIDGINKTKAGKNKKIIAMDGALLSGFGPRLGEAILQLNTLLGGNGK